MMFSKNRLAIAVMAATSAMVSAEEVPSRSTDSDAAGYCDCDTY